MKLGTTLFFGSQILFNAHISVKIFWLRQKKICLYFLSMFYLYVYLLRSHNILIETTWFISDQIYILPTAGQSRKDNKDRGKRVKSQIGAFQRVWKSKFYPWRIFVRPGKYGWNSSLTCLEEISRLNHPKVWAFPPLYINIIDRVKV